MIERGEAREVVGYDPDKSGADGDAFQRPVNVVVVDQDGDMENPLDGEGEDTTTGNNLTDAEPTADDDAIADR